MTELEEVEHIEKMLDKSLSKFFLGSNLDYTLEEDIETIIQLPSIPTKVREQVLELEIIRKFLPDLVTKTLKSTPTMIN